MPPKKPASQLGGIAGYAGMHFADIQYRDEQTKLKKRIRGPVRFSKSRAESDIARIRDATDGYTTWGEAIASMHAKNLELHKEAEKEARVAMGIEQYEAQRLAHQVEDSDPETETEFDDNQDGVWAEDFSDPNVLDKLFPPPAPRVPVRPPLDADDATSQLSRFRYTLEAPSVLSMLLAARADPNVVAKEGDLPPLQTAMLLADPRHVHEFRALLLQFGATNAREEKIMWGRRQQRDIIDPIYVAKLRRSASLMDFPYLTPRDTNTTEFLHKS